MAINMRSNMFDDEEFDGEPDGNDGFDDLNNMSMSDFLEYLYEHRFHFFGSLDEFDESVEYELKEKLSEYIVKPSSYAYQRFGNMEYPIAVSYGEWVVFKN